MLGFAQDSTAVVQQATNAVTSMAPVYMALIGVLARFIVVGLKAASAQVRALPEWQQVAIGSVVVSALTVARHYVPGLTLPADVDSYTVDTIQAAGSVLVMALAKKRAAGATSATAPNAGSPS